jgi:hypothetical protein
MGCADSFPCALPDGRRPDVIAFGPGRRLVFIGDAKDTETPGCVATWTRLRAYLPWARAIVASGRSLVFGLCFGELEDLDGWANGLAAIAAEAGLTGTVRVVSFGPGYHLAWLASGIGTDGLVTPSTS